MKNKRFFDLLKEAVEVNDDGLQLRSYSGRYMYGARCIALVVDSSASPFWVIAEAVAGVQDEDERWEFAEVLGGTRTDSLGLGEVLYWPGMDWEAAFDAALPRREEDDDEE